MKPFAIAVPLLALGVAGCGPAGQNPTQHPSSTPVAVKFVSVVMAKGWPDPNVMPIGFQETGVKPHSQVSYQVTATATADYGCFRSQGTNSTPLQLKSTTAQGSRSTTAQFAADGTGFVEGVIVVSPPPPSDTSCPAGSALSIWRFHYSNVVISDLSNGIVHPAPDLGYGGQT